MNRHRLIAVHLLNDFSGSPLVLRQAIESLKDEYDVHLFTATPSGAGFLSGMEDIAVHPLRYRWSRYKIVTLVLFMISQLMLMGKLLFFLRKNDIVYINTLLPFGGALAAKVRGCKVIYHVHEISIRPVLLKRFVTAVAGFTSSCNIFVSDFLRSSCRIKGADVVLPNALSIRFLSRALKMPSPHPGEVFTITMLCSMKAYKGIYEFAALAKELPGFRFRLVLNTSPASANKFAREISAPGNLEIYPACADTIPVYAASHVILNLSRPDEWIETFGMTVLEAMACGRPVIVPQIGGVTEIVDHGVQGFHINGKDIISLKAAIQKLENDPRFYQRLSEAARERAVMFSPDLFAGQLNEVFSKLISGQDLEQHSNIWNSSFIHDAERFGI